MYLCKVKINRFVMKRWMSILVCLLYIALGAPLLAQTDASSLEGRWYLRFEYDDGPRGHSEDLFAPTERYEQVAEGRYYSIITSYKPVVLELQPSGIAVLRLTELRDVRSLDGAAQIVQRVRHTRTWALELGWARIGGKGLRFKLLKGTDRSSRYGYRLTREEDEEMLVGGPGGSYLPDEELLEGLKADEDPFVNRRIEEFVGNLNRMSFRSQGSEDFTLDGRKTFRSPNVEGPGFIWETNLVRASRSAERVAVEHNLVTLEYRLMAGKAAAMLAEHYQESIAPWSGRNVNYSLEMAKATLVKPGVASITATLQWEAMDLLKGIPYGTCEVVGRLLLSAPDEAKSAWHAQFTLVKRNEHAMSISNDADWKSLERLGPFALE